MEDRAARVSKRFGTTNSENLLLYGERSLTVAARFCFIRILT